MLVTFSMPAKTDTKAELEKLETVADAPLAAVAAVQKAHPELLVAGARRRVGAEGRSGRRSAPTRPRRCRSRWSAR